MCFACCSCVEVEGQEGAPAGRVNGEVIGNDYKAAIRVVDATRPVTGEYQCPREIGQGRPWHYG